MPRPVVKVPAKEAFLGKGLTAITHTRSSLIVSSVLSSSFFVT